MTIIINNLFPMTSDGLIVADYRAGKIYRVESNALTCIDDGVAAEHAGILGLPENRGLAWIDDRRGTLTVHSNGSRVRLPIAIPGEHLAGERTGRYLISSTGTGANPQPWSDVVNIVDLVEGHLARFRSRVGEPGVMIVNDQVTGVPTVLLRHREPGLVEALTVAECLAAGPHVPQLGGQTTNQIADDGHGDAVDSASGIAAVATSRGLERFVVENGAPRAIGIVDWPCDGRAYYLRYDAATRRVLAVLRGGPADPTRWTSWRNNFVEIDPVTGMTRTSALPNGLAFRFGSGGDRAAVAVINPDGDTLNVIDRIDAGLVAGCIDLQPMSNPPAPGRLPWDPGGDGAAAQRRAVAVDPTGTMVAVTRGGHGEVHLFDATGTTTLTAPTALDEGGCLYWPGGSFDPIGR